MKTVKTNSIGYRIRQARDKARISQEALSKSLGVSKRTLISWEKNERNPKDAMLQLIAEITSTNIEMLLNPQSISPAINNPEHEAEKMYKLKYELLMEKYMETSELVIELQQRLLISAGEDAKKPEGFPKKRQG